MGACVVGNPVGLDDVGDGVGLGEGDGDGLGDADGEELCDAGDGDGLADVWGEVNTLRLGELLGLPDVAFPWVADDPAEGARPPLPLGLPGPPVWLEVLVPGGL